MGTKCWFSFKRLLYQGIMLIGVTYLPVQAQIHEDFEDPGLNDWQMHGDTIWSITSVNPLENESSLHHVYDNPESGIDVIGRYMNQLKLGEEPASWNFTVKYAYSPSSVNNWNIFLMADGGIDRMKTRETHTACIFGVNFESYDDTLKLWTQQEGRITTKLSTTVNWQKDVEMGKPVAFRILHSGDQWSVLWDTALDGHYQEIGKTEDTTRRVGSYFGIAYAYSSTQDRKLWIDDITVEGAFLKDTIPPEIVDVTPLDSVTLRVSFSEAVTDTTLLDIENYQLTHNEAHPAEITYIRSDRITLQFAEPFPDQLQSSLKVSELTDRHGNDANLQSNSFSYYIPQPYDMVINEIMADPSPPLDLPQSEYIELYNTTSYPINLDNWQLFIGEDRAFFPDVTVPPHAHLLVTKEATSGKWNEDIQVIELFSSSVNNRGEPLVIKDDQGRMISFVHFSKEWYEGSVKGDGGWSLEQIDPDNPCGGQKNWVPSKAPEGGTPGQRNSVTGNDPDVESPVLQRIASVNDSSFRLFFSEPLNPASLDSTFHISGSPDIASIEQRQLEYPDYHSVRVNLSEPLQQHTRYTLQFDYQLRDCAGNLAEEPSVHTFMLPQSPDTMDLVINEVLFNPDPGDVDFVEVYNRSEKALDLSDVYIATRDPESGNISSSYQIAKQGYHLMPGDYAVITSDPATIASSYFVPSPGLMVVPEGMPSFNNKKGRVVLHDKYLRVIDELSYRESMHFSLLDNVEGISLERIHPSDGTNQASNWHSASQAAGCATPGYKNSQYQEPSDAESSVSMAHEVFSPNNDGYKDVLSLTYQFDQSGWVGTVSVYDASGRLVRRIANNRLLGTHGTLYWKGLTSEKRKAPTGTYVILFKAFHETGKVKKIKKVCVLSGDG